MIAQTVVESKHKRAACRCGNNGGGDCEHCLVGCTECVMSCQDFADGEDFSQQIDEQFWDGGFRSDELFEAMCAAAAEQGVELTDKDDWSYDGYFWNVWQCTEKGLS